MRVMVSEPAIRFCWVRPKEDSDLPLPKYMTDHASGMDLHAAIAGDLLLAPGQIALVPTGLSMALPEGFEAQVRPRSGLACKYGVTVVNAPGTIDADYRGEIMVGLVNLGGAPYSIRRADRVAQLVIQRVWKACIELVDSLDETDRGHGGFGHTGQ